MFQALTRIAKNYMVIFDPGAGGAASRILSTILLRTVLYLGDAVVSVGRELLKCQLGQFCSPQICTPLQIIFPGKTGPISFPLANEFNCHRCEIISIADIG